MVTLMWLQITAALLAAISFISLLRFFVEASDGFGAFIAGLIFILALMLMSQVMVIPESSYILNVIK